MELISVIVPIYNVEKYLSKCIDSILNQTYKNIEVLLVNDGSTDNSEQICLEYAKKDNRIKYLKKKNGGLSDARNYGIEHANGEYLSFVDSDDYLDCTFLEKLYYSIINNNTEVAVCSYELINELDNKVINTINIPSHTEKTTGIEIMKGVLNFKFRQPFVVVWNKLYKKYIFKNLRFEVGKLHEDEFMVHKLWYYTKNISLVNEPLYKYLRRENSITQSQMNLCRFNSLIESFLDRINFYCKKKETEFEYITITSFMTFIINFYNDHKNDFITKKEYYILKYHYRKTYSQFCKFESKNFARRIYYLIGYYSFNSAFLFKTIIKKLIK